MAFESAIDTLNAAVASRLANTACTIGGVSGRVLFGNGYQDQFGVGAPRPELACSLADFADLALDSVVVIGASQYQVLTIEDDGTGWVTAQLRLAA